ncbi:hypothetical protein GOB17_26970 [Sinorhizobium meliloti]|uniref:cytochrome-c peroxidase n=1 Tax=Rhizobium meliloti TaxID=382 RepID=UPI000FD879D8|nr:cytochrome c peroxidase [Sinorhizobium meliloti]MDX2329295.1 hypothetical protein [Sinorhizobium medicae]MDW9583239.1 hypothetical protein [Sinorhizobium meliloti]MDX0185360.1 hypothetical protein [Sinorhizobium meliloti]MDX0283769.1 hypothetical protein [Sinorhizobium meliloti]RVL29960.1 hypothetical protein CN144_15115 [Sinorhizobium meliloti]
MRSPQSSAEGAQDRLTRRKGSAGAIRAAIVAASVCAAWVPTNNVSASDVAGPKALLELGERLFHDPLLSGSGTLACSSCHPPSLGFADGRTISEIYPGGISGFRNTPSLVSVAGQARFRRDASLPGPLVAAIAAEFASPLTMAMNAGLAAERMRQQEAYRTLFDRAGLGEPDLQAAAEAISAYLQERSRRALAHTEDIIERERTSDGGGLFFGDAGCSSCHSGPRLSDGRIHYLCAKETEAQAAQGRAGCLSGTVQAHLSVAGRIALSAHLASLGVAHSQPPSIDVGAAAFENDEEASFVTPSLIGVAETGPYLHNGSAATLEAVLLGARPGDIHASATAALTEEQAEALVSFLKALTLPQEPLASYSLSDFMLATGEELWPSTGYDDP